MFTVDYQVLLIIQTRTSVFSQGHYRIASSIGLSNPLTFASCILALRLLALSCNVVLYAMHEWYVHPIPHAFKIS